MIGKFIAKVLEVGVSATKDGAPQIVANIRCFPSEADANQGIKPFEKIFYGSLKPAAFEITMRSLQVMGYAFTVTDLSDIAAGTGLDFNKEFEVVIDTDTYNGKTTERIKGIYEIGAAGFSTMNAGDAVQLLKGVEVQGSVLGFMQSKGIMPATKKAGAPGLDTSAKATGKTAAPPF